MIINRFYWCALLVLCLVTSTIAQKQTQPNIIIIFADDMGYADIEGFGAHYKTPNILNLQQAGMKFTSFYSQPQCSPSRAALLTGCYPQRVGIPWVVGPEGPAWTADKYFVGLNAIEQTLPELLKQKNYKTAVIGKWHLGHHAQHLPTHHGFDEFFGLPYSNDMRPADNSEWPDLPLYDGDKVIETNPDQSLLTSRYTERAIEFISENRHNPFFLYLAHSMPHIPIFASDKFKGKSSNGLYADVIQELDWSTGEILNALKRYNLSDNTLVIFTSDNGPWLRYGKHAGSAGSFREGKGTTFEGGVRVPMIAYWPGKIRQGSTCHEMTALIDLLPTITEITGVKNPELKVDGKSILPLLAGKKQKADREIHYYFQNNELQAIRKGKWKLHLPHGYEHVTNPGADGRRGEVTESHIELSLFNLDADPGEQDNVAGQHPEIVTELEASTKKFKLEIEREKRPAGSSE